MIVDPRAFQSWDIQVGLANPLSGDHAKPSPLISLLEMNGAELALDAPLGLSAGTGRLYPEGHHVLLTILAHDSGVSQKRLRFSSTARVQRLETHVGDRARVELLLLQYDGQSWRELWGALAARQIQILQFLREVRGW